MKNIALAAILNLALSLSAFSQVDIVRAKKHGLEALLVEKIAVPGNLTDVPEGSTTYRLFVDLAQNHKFLSCFGVDNTTPKINLKIESTQPFFNHPNGNAKGSGANPGWYGIAPSLEYDSYVTDGRIGNDYVGVLKALNNAGYVDITEATTPKGDLVVPIRMDILINSTSTILDDVNSGWGVPGGIAGPNSVRNFVFIGQLTTAGELTMSLNINVQNPLGDFNTITGVNYTTSTEASSAPGMKNAKQMYSFVSSDDDKIYPNPSNDFVNVVTQGTSTVKIYNALGTLVRSKENVKGKTTFDVQNLNPGVYMVEINDKLFRLLIK